MSGDWTRGSIGGFSLVGCDVIVGSAKRGGGWSVGRSGEKEGTCNFDNFPLNSYYL